MQEIYNQGWYAGNESVKYPLHLDASGISDDGEELPSELIADIKIVSTKKQCFYIAGVNCSEYIFSVVIASERGLEAAVTLEQPVHPLAHYSLECFHSDITGVLAVGHPHTHGQWRFSSPSQSKLDQNASIILNPWPVTSIGCRYPLKNEVMFEGGNDIKVTVEPFTISEKRTPTNTFKTNAIVFRLDDTIEEGEEERSKYLAPCALRPDNGDCDYVTSLGGATPDCNGNLNITFTTDEEMSELFDNSITTTHCGITLMTDETHPEKEENNYGRCGDDLCAPTEEVMKSLAPNTTVELSEEVFPVEGYTIGYSEGKLIPPDHDEAYATTARTGETVTAIFRRNDSCGIAWNIDGKREVLVYDGQYLTMKGQSAPASSAIPRVTMILSANNGVITGTLKGIPLDYTNSNLVTLAELTTKGNTLGRTGIYLKDSSCIKWSIE